MKKFVLLKISAVLWLAFAGRVEAQFVTLNSGEYDNDGLSPHQSTQQSTQRRYVVDCNRQPSGVTSDKTAGNGGFAIRFSGSPKKYVPREGYTGECPRDQTILPTSQESVAVSLIRTDSASFSFRFGSGHRISIHLE